MATKGTRGTSIDFGDYELSVSLVKATRSRDIKAEYVRDQASKPDPDTGEVQVKPEKTTMTGSTGGTRQQAPDVYKAVRLSDEKVLRLPEDRLEEIVEASKREGETMRVLEAIDYRQVPTERIVGTYYLQPRAGTAKGCRMLFEGLRETDLCAVVKWVSSSREKLGVIRARKIDGKSVLHLSELAFANDAAEVDDDVSLDDVEVGPKSIAAAASLLAGSRRGHGGERKIDTASDTAVDARVALVDELMDAELASALGQGAEEETSVEADTEAVTA
jgi:non-homologous end joining protein Ku